jgi:hypothetical protein
MTEILVFEDLFDCRLEPLSRERGFESLPVSAQAPAQEYPPRAPCFRQAAILTR